MGATPPPPPPPPVNIIPGRRPRVEQTVPIFRGKGSAERYWREQLAGPLEFWDGEDASDLAAPPLMCSADDYAAVLRERGLMDVSKVRFCSQAGHKMPRQAPTSNPGTR